MFVTFFSSQKKQRAPDHHPHGRNRSHQPWPTHRSLRSTTTTTTTRAWSIPLWTALHLPPGISEPTWSQSQFSCVICSQNQTVRAGLSEQQPAEPSPLTSCKQGFAWRDQREHQQQRDRQGASYQEQSHVREKLSQDSALFILSAARQALDAAGDTGAPGAHGKVEIPLITRGFDSYQAQGWSFVYPCKWINNSCCWDLNVTLAHTSYLSILVHHCII